LEFEDESALQFDSTELTIGRNTRLGVSSDGARAIFSDGGTIGIWHLDTGRVVSVALEDFATEALGIEGGVAIAGSILGTVCLIDSEQGRIVRFLDDGRGLARTRRILDLVIDTTGQRAITASGDGSVRMWDLASGDERVVLQGEGKVDAVAIAPNGRFAYSVVGDTVVASDLIARKPLQRLSLDHNITAIAVTPDGMHAVLGDESGRVHFVTLDAVTVAQTPIQ
jgi:WD40 repeat protein